MKNKEQVWGDHQTADPFEEIIDHGLISKIQFQVVLIAFILMLFDGIDITLMSFVAQRVSEQLQINATNLGLVFSVTLAGMMMGAMFIAPFSDKVGRRKVLIYSVFFIGVSMICTGLVSSFWQLIVVRVITGLGVGAMLANLTALTVEYMPTKYKSFSVAIVAAGFPMGATIGGIIVGPVLPLYGWEIIFITVGIVTLVMTGVVYFCVPESLQFLRAEGSTKSLINANALLSKMAHKPLDYFPSSEHATLPKASVSSILSHHWRIKTLTLWTTFFFVFLSMYFLMSWLPKLVMDAGLSEKQGVFSAVALNSGGVIGTLLLGWFSAKLGLTNLISIFLAVASVLMLGVSFALDYINLFALLFILGFFLQGGFVGLYSTSAKLYPTEVRATAVGWALGIGRFGAVFGPYAGGLLIYHGFNMGLIFIIFAIPLLLACVLAYQLKVA